MVDVIRYTLQCLTETEKKAPVVSASGLLRPGALSCVREFECKVILGSRICSGGEGGGGRYCSYNLLNEIQTMFSRLAQRSARVLPADWRPDYAHYVKKHRLTVLRRNKNIAAHGGTVPHYCIFVVRKFCRFSDIVCRFLFLLKNFPLQSLEYATYGCV